MIRTPRLAVALMAATALALPAAAQEVLRVPYSGDIGSFDPDNAFEVDGLGAVNAVYEGLVEYAPGSTGIVGLLAESWTVSEDGTLYTFDLRDGVSFHDGTPMTSAEVMASFERRKTGELVLSYFLWNVEEMTAPDPDTFVIRLGMAQPSFLDTLASPWGPKVVAPAALAEGGDWMDDNAVGTGPFSLARFERGTGYELAKYDGYWGAAPWFDTVEIAIVPDVSQQVLQLRAGDLDAVPRNYPWAQLRALPPGIEATASPSMALVMAFVKPGTALEDPAVREAVMTAINPAGWAEAVFGPYARPAKSLFPVAMIDPDTVPGAEAVSFPTDMEAAKAAIDAAGTVSLTLGYPIDEAQNVNRVTDLMLADLAAIGVQAEAIVVPKDEQYNFAADMSRAPDVMLARNNPDAAHPETQAFVFYTEGAPINVMGVSNPEADALAGEAGSMTDIAARDAKYLEASKLWVEAGQFIPLVDLDDVVVHREGLTDLGLRPVFPPGNIDFGTVRYAE